MAIAMAAIPLQEVDSREIVTVLDNVIDVLMASTDIAKRFPLTRDALSEDVLLAEHGYAALVTARAGDVSESVLFDAGLSKGGLMHNLDVLEIKPRDLHSVVLSHGHTDHCQGLMGMLERVGERKLPLLLHPDAFLKRRVVFPDGHEVNLPPPDRRVLSHEGVELIEDRAPSYLLGGIALITGQIERTTSFETGFPIHQVQVDGQWQPDPYIHDDQAMVFNVRNKGLAILTGCGHAGLINTIRHSQRLTGIDPVYAVMGGFHRSGALFEPIIEPTIAALKEIGPKVVVPAHCTGWKATHTIARELPDAFIQNSVGTRFVL